MTTLHEPATDAPCLEGGKDEAAADGAVAKPTFSKAALRRLAHDAGCRLTKPRYDEVAAALDGFLRDLVDGSVEAMRFAKKRSVSVAHVVHAARGLRVAVPAEALEAAAQKGGIKLLRCNVRAPPAARKASVMNTEISSASFARVAKGLVLKREAPPRLSAQARRLMHVFAEMKVVEAFGKGHEGAVVERADLTRHAVALAFACDDALAADIKAEVEAVCARIPDLLEIASTKTIDLRLLEAAAAPLKPPLGPLPDSRDPAVKIVERMLRGSAVDRRLVSSGAAFVTACLREAHALPKPQPQSASSSTEPPGDDGGQATAASTEADAGSGPAARKVGRPKAKAKAGAAAPKAKAKAKAKASAAPKEKPKGVIKATKQSAEERAPVESVDPAPA